MGGRIASRLKNVEASPGFLLASGEDVPQIHKGAIVIT